MCELEIITCYCPVYLQAKQVREANRSNYTLLSQQASSSWLKVNAPVKSSSKPSQRSSSLDSSHKRKSESDHGESPLKRSVSSDRLPVPCSASSDADLHSVLAGLKNQFDTAVENMKAAYQEQTAAYREQKEELRKERELRIKAEERMNTLWGAFQAHTRISAQQHHDGEIDVMGSVTSKLHPVISMSLWYSNCPTLIPLPGFLFEQMLYVGGANIIR